MKTLILLMLSPLFCLFIEFTPDNGFDKNSAIIQGENHDEAVKHKVIFFAGNHCKSECYESRSIKKACMWFSTDDGLPVKVSDLSGYTGSYTEEYDKKYFQGEVISSKTRKVPFTWDNAINRVYIGNSYTKVIICDEVNYSGTCIEVWGEGCYDLDRSGFINKAESIKLVRY